MEELTIAQAIIEAGETIAFAIVIAAFIRGFLNG